MTGNQKRIFIKIKLRKMKTTSLLMIIAILIVAMNSVGQSIAPAPPPAGISEKKIAPKTYHYTNSDDSLFLDSLFKGYDKSGSNTGIKKTTPAGTTVTIGTQTWMVKNLDVSAFRNGDAIKEAKDTEKEWDDATDKGKPAWCYYNNDPGNGKIYGKLYNWAAVTDSRGLAPEGFHVATDAEWTVLIEFLGGKESAGGKLKEAGASNWNPNMKSTKSNEFTALPGGHREGGRSEDHGEFLDIGGFAHWWTATKHNNDGAWSIYLYAR